MTTIKGYTFDESKEIITGSATAWKAENRSKDLYFFKRYTDLARPTDKVRDEKLRKQRNLAFDDFMNRRMAVKTALSSYAVVPDGNIVIPLDYFEYQGRFYSVTMWKPISGLEIKDIARLSEKDKLLILRTAASNLKNVHSKNVLHLDIKPDNMPVYIRAASGKPAIALMDFDESVAINTSNLPSPQFMRVTESYISPEHQYYKLERSGLPPITKKSDIFSLGLVFYEYWTGQKTQYIKDGEVIRKMPYWASLAQLEISFPKDTPEDLKDLITAMLDRDPDKRPDADEVLERLPIPGAKPPVPPKPPQPKNATVHLKTNNGIREEVKDVTVGDAPVTLPDPSLKKNGHKFVGWSTTQLGTGTVYKTLSLKDLNGKPEITLYAKWERERIAPDPRTGEYSLGSKCPATIADFEIDGNSVKFIFKSGGKANYTLPQALRMGWLKHNT